MSNTVEIQYPIRAYGATVYLQVHVTPWCARGIELHKDVRVYDEASGKWLDLSNTEDGLLLVAGIIWQFPSDWASIQEAAEQAKAEAREPDPDLQHDLNAA